MAPIPYLGEIFSLLCALAWAVAVILFRKSGESVHPLALNYFKDVLAVVLFIPTIFILGETNPKDATLTDYLILLTSGAIGIGIGDTLFFKGLNILGAGLQAIVDCLYSPFVIALSMIWLGERLSFWQYFGVILIIGAVLLATYEKNPQRLSRSDLFKGSLFSVLAVMAMAVGIVMVKPLLDRSPLIWLTEVRLIGGVCFLSLVFIFHKKRKPVLNTLRATRSWRYVISGSICGAYLSMILWLAGMKFTKASIASALNQTSNLLIFVLAAIFLKELITLRRALAIVVAVAGVFLVTFA